MAALFKTLAALAGIALGSFATEAAGPAVATRYTEPGRLKDPQITQDACLARAEATLASTGFSAIERTQQSRYGTKGEYTGTIRCIVDKQIVIFVVSGPSRQISDQGEAALFQNFEAEP